MNAYLTSLFDDVLEGRHYNVSLCAAICDAPAPAFVNQIKSHSGYSGCDKCTQPGVWNGKMTFPETTAPLQTGVQFKDLLM